MPVFLPKGYEIEDLKGTPSKDTSWPENIQNVQLFLFAHLARFFYHRGSFILVFKEFGEKA